MKKMNQDKLFNIVGGLGGRCRITHAGTGWIACDGGEVIYEI